jgi:hypothetical protein
MGYASRLRMLSSSSPRSIERVLRLQVVLRIMRALGLQLGRENGTGEISV